MKKKTLALIMLAVMSFPMFLVASSNSTAASDNTNTLSQDNPQDIPTAQDVQAESDLAASNSIDKAQNDEQEASNVNSAAEGMAS